MECLVNIWKSNQESALQRATNINSLEGFTIAEGFYN